MENLSYLNEVIEKLIREGLYLPAFILKSQIIEFDLKRFLWQYCDQYSIKPGHVTKEFLTEATLGALYQKILVLKDKVIDTAELAKKIKEFKYVRNELVHEIISSKLTIGQVNIKAQKGLGEADDLMKETWVRLEWIGDFYSPH